MTAEKRERLLIIQNQIQDLIIDINVKEIDLEWLKLGAYGSLHNGTSTIDSDLDLTILTNSFVDERYLY